MQNSLITTTFLMGLVGGPHCIAMCGAACGGLIEINKSQAIWQFQLGRVIGYAILGALAASSVNSLAWLSSQTSILHPLWTFFHIFVLCWGVILLTYARQPLWTNQVESSIWKYVQHLALVKGGLFFTGTIWALLPCGLLYSALLVSSLAGSALQGGMSMATFALGSAISLSLGPWLWLKFKNKNYFFSEAFSMRAAGLILMIIAGWSIWLDVVHETRLFCAIS